MFGVWDVQDVGCLACEMFGDVGCLVCGKFGM